MRDVLTDAADLLAGGEPPAPAHGEAAGLLRALDYAGDGPEDAAARGNRVLLLRMAARLRRLFALPTPQAPGLVFLGGEADPAILGPAFADCPAGSLAGSGARLRQAFEACVGEAVEYLSQFAQADDLVAAGSELPRIAPFPGADAPGWNDGGVADGWVAARRLNGDAQVLLPAGRCLRRADPGGGVPPFALSTGCAAGATLADAALHGLLELIERDAASLWWHGGRRGRALTGAAGDVAARFLAELRGGAGGRRSWVVDITTDLGIPAVAAISVDSGGSDPGNDGFACGLAAGMTMAEAVRRALQEMCHIEIAYAVIAAKRAERGDDALNPADQRHLQRARSIRADCPLLHPATHEEATGPAACAGDEAPPEGPAAWQLDWLVRRLDAAGVPTYLVDLTRPQFGIPACRVVAPDLQLEPCSLPGKRLLRAIRETGGGIIHSNGIPLL